MNGINNSSEVFSFAFAEKCQHKTCALCLLCDFRISILFVRIGQYFFTLYKMELHQHIAVIHTRSKAVL